MYRAGALKRMLIASFALSIVSNIITEADMTVPEPLDAIVQEIDFVDEVAIGYIPDVPPSKAKNLAKGAKPAQKYGTPAGKQPGLGSTCTGVKKVPLELPPVASTLPSCRGHNPRPLYSVLAKGHCSNKQRRRRRGVFEACLPVVRAGDALRGRHAL